MRVPLMATTLVLTSCGFLVGPATGTRDGIDEAEEPPPIVLHLAEGDEPVEIWTSCWTTGDSAMCRDGGPPEGPLEVGSPDEVAFGFDASGWTFEATFRELGDRCGRSVRGEVEKTGDQTFLIAPAGPSATWDVDVSGRGPQGDVVATFRWATPRSGSLPAAATGTASVLADHDGRLDSYGVGVALSDLAQTPEEASGTLAVTSAEGIETVIDLRWEDGCQEAGTASFRAPIGRGVEVARSGSAPFTYQATVVLDGTTYVGTGTWPDDQIPDQQPAVALTWSPPLPVYRG